MKKRIVVLFDLDGTIIDSGEGVINSAKYALEKFGIKEENSDKLKRFVGPPLMFSFSSFYGLSKEDAKEAIKYYREYYTKKGIFECFVYDGIEELLKALKAKKYRIILTTSKPELFAKKILKHFGIIKYFDFVAGASLDELTRITKDDVLKYAQEKNSIDKKNDKVFLVGDRCYDIDGAHNFGFKAISVLFGYGSREEFEEHGSEYIISDPGEVIRIIEKEEDSE